ncbi:MAG: Uma2 family endonuclease [Okeania sp. SIO3B3]|nr:Uma2 family endonuclease [Okeania sp. SIO3B3]
MTALTIDVSALGELTDDKLFDLCTQNRDVRFERTCRGELIVMSPAGLETSHQNLEIASVLRNWNKASKLGKVFGPDAGFTLRNKAMLSPDAAWVTQARWEALPKSEQKRFGRISPDFVVELRSPSDRLPQLKAKMDEWMENGCRLGWLIDPHNEKVYIYRADGSMSVVESFDETVSGENVLPGFELVLSELR